MVKQVLLFIAGLLFSFTSFAQEIWSVDSPHSNIHCIIPAPGNNVPVIVRDINTVYSVLMAFQNDIRNGILSI